jgi:type II secretory pathway pseudopilin PulG
MRKRAGFTLVELLIYLGLSVVISGVGYSLLNGQTRLYAKNMSIVRSHTNLRSVLDRLVNNLQQANSLPVLISTTGASSAAPSSGLYYDRYRGDPYVVTNPGGSGLTAATTSITITRSTAALASPPLPAAGDTLLIDASPSPVRALIATSTPGAIDTVNQRQPIVLTLSSALGTAVSWTSPQVQTSRLVHREAFIVVPVGDRSELRFFKNFEPMPTLTNAANYTVISNQISVQAGETTPFSIDLVNSDSLVRASLFARSTDYSTYLGNKQLNEFNTFVRLSTSLPSRLRPKQ